MTLEPSWSLPIVLITGVAATYVWYVLAQSTIGDRVFAYPREHWGPLWNCPWCLGFWVTGLILLATGTYDPLTHLAAAGVTGLAGSHSG